MGSSNPLPCIDQTLNGVHVPLQFSTLSDHRSNFPFIFTESSPVKSHQRVIITSQNWGSKCLCFILGSKPPVVDFNFIFLDDHFPHLLESAVKGNKPLKFESIGMSRQFCYFENWHVTIIWSRYGISILYCPSSF